MPVGSASPGSYPSALPRPALTAALPYDLAIDVAPRPPPYIEPTLSARPTARRHTRRTLGSPHLAPTSRLPLRCTEPTRGCPSELPYAAQVPPPRSAPHTLPTLGDELNGLAREAKRTQKCPPPRGRRCRGRGFSQAAYPLSQGAAPPPGLSPSQGRSGPHPPPSESPHEGLHWAEVSPQRPLRPGGSPPRPLGGVTLHRPPSVRSPPAGRLCAPAGTLFGPLPRHRLAPPLPSRWPRSTSSAPRTRCL